MTKSRAEEAWVRRFNIYPTSLTPRGGHRTWERARWDGCAAATTESDDGLGCSELHDWRGPPRQPRPPDGHPWDREQHRPQLRGRRGSGCAAATIRSVLTTLPTPLSLLTTAVAGIHCPTFTWCWSLWALHDLLQKVPQCIQLGVDGSQRVSLALMRIMVETRGVNWKEPTTTTRCPLRCT